MFKVPDPAAVQAHWEPGVVQDVCLRDVEQGGWQFCTAAGWAEASQVLWDGSLRVKSPPTTVVGSAPSSGAVHPLLSSLGQGEVPGHPQQVHGDPRHSLLRDAAAARGPGICEEPWAAAAARVSAAAEEGEGGREPAEVSVGPRPPLTSQQ